MVLDAQPDGFRPMAMIPFRVSADRAVQQARAWVRARWLAPHALAGIVEKARIAGLYVPFWTFDSTEAVAYWATVREGYGEDTETREITGRMTTRFDDLLMPASSHVTPMIRDGILHEFSPEALKPCMPGFLAGFAAEQHGQTVAEGLEANARDKKILMKARIRAHLGQSGVSNIRYITDSTGIRYRRLLMPVWILHYRLEDTAYRVVVSGIDGRTFGERPFSRRKLALMSAGLAAAACAFGAWWGWVAAPAM